MTEVFYHRKSEKARGNLTFFTLAKSSLDLVESRLAAIRRECGDDLDIIVENHCRTDLTSAIQIGQLCDKYRVFFYEEMVTPVKTRQHALVRER